MSTWSSESTENLLGRGVDAECVSRFERVAIAERASGLVFSEDEIRHRKSLPWLAMGQCAAFCCKESSCKAVREPLNLSDCELFSYPFSSTPDLQISPAFRWHFGIKQVAVRIRDPQDGEIVASVFVSGSGPE